MATSNIDKEQFLNLIEGDKELFITLLDLFKKDWPSLIEQLEKAMDSGQLNSVEQVSHRLKGNLRNFYAHQAAEKAMSFEVAGRENDLGSVKGKVGELTLSIQAVEKDLEQLLQTF
ncbi:MAG: Hpt domain-containing protein [Bdellovibrionaceae bacterium]|nr:Hpt domain-containing protein [Pseudobdellovibrionaceae bacterium]